MDNSTFQKIPQRRAKPLQTPTGQAKPKREKARDWVRVDKRAAWG